MARPWRREFARALYHLTAHGSGRREIFPGHADDDRAPRAWIDLKNQVLCPIRGRRDLAPRPPGCWGGARLPPVRGCCIPLANGILVFERVPRVPWQGAATSHSRAYGEEPQHRHGTRGACAVAEIPLARGIKERSGLVRSPSGRHIGRIADVYGWKPPEGWRTASTP